MFFQMCWSPNSLVTVTASWSVCGRPESKKPLDFVLESVDRRCARLRASLAGAQGNVVSWFIPVHNPELSVIE